MDEHELIRVEGHPTLGRDSQSNAILNTDDSGYMAYKRARDAARRKDRDLEDLRKEVDELKDLVHNLVQKADK